MSLQTARKASRYFYSKIPLYPKKRDDIVELPITRPTMYQMDFMKFNCLAL